MVTKNTKSAKFRKEAQSVSVASRSCRCRFANAIGPPLRVVPSPDAFGEVENFHAYWNQFEYQEGSWFERFVKEL